MIASRTIDMEDKQCHIQWAMKRRRQPKQGDLFLDVGRGGKRSGAGRPKDPSSGVSHLRRPSLGKHNPVMVTMRAQKGLRLRRKRTFAVIRKCIAAAQERFGFHVVDYSVQQDHLHLIVEASDRRSLARGMQGLTVRFARRLNRLLGRKGKLFTDRYHARQLTTPTEVRNALRYVLSNFRKHLGQRRVRVGKRYVDHFSSAPHFAGWRGRVRVTQPPAEDVTAPPRAYLLKTGWRRRGLLDPSDIPGSRQGYPN